MLQNGAQQESQGSVGEDVGSAQGWKGVQLGWWHPWYQQGSGANPPRAQPPCTDALLGA